jgi:hypothetical protein
LPARKELRDTRRLETFAGTRGQYVPVARTGSRPVTVPANVFSHQASLDATCMTVCPCPYGGLCMGPIPPRDDTRRLSQDQCTGWHAAWCAIVAALRTGPDFSIGAFGACAEPLPRDGPCGQHLNEPRRRNRSVSSWRDNGPAALEAGIPALSFQHKVRCIVALRQLRCSPLAGVGGRMRCWRRCVGCRERRRACRLPEASARTVTTVIAESAHLPEVPARTVLRSDPQAEPTRTYSWRVRARHAVEGGWFCASSGPGGRFARRLCRPSERRWGAVVWHGKAGARVSR